MPWFTINGLATSARHSLIGLGRVIQGRRRDHFIEQIRSRGVVLHPVTERSRHYVDCPFCGYALASFEPIPGWIVETCSAFYLPEMIRNPKFANYMSRLSNIKYQSAASLERENDLAHPMAVPAAPGSD